MSQLLPDVYCITVQCSTVAMCGHYLGGSSALPISRDPVSDCRLCGWECSIFPIRGGDKGKWRQSKCENNLHNYQTQVTWCKFPTVICNTNLIKIMND